MTDLRNGWQDLTVADICDEVYDGPHATPTKLDEGPIFLNISSLVNGRIVLSESVHLSEEDFVKWTRRVTPQPDDLVFSYETRLGEAALIPEGLRCCLGRRMALIRPYREMVDPKYLLYYFLSPILQNEIRKYTTAGSTVERLALADVRKFRVLLPPLPEQRAIASILGALDDKIELNRRMNATLESLARAIFKSWFVDFDPVKINAGQMPASAAIPSTNDPKTLDLFPSTFQDSELGQIPEGWTVQTMEQASSLIIDYRGKTPKKLGSDWSETGVRAVSAKNVKDGRLVRPETMRSVDDELYAKWMKDELALNDILMTSEAPLGELYFLATNANYCLSQRIYGIRANPEVCESSFLYFWLESDACQDEIKSRATGTTVVGIRQSELRKVRVLAPPIEVQKLASEVLHEALINIHSNELESATLNGLRDSLLPQLLSGEIPVTEFVESER